MRRLIALVALALASLTPIVAVADSRPQVTLATAGIAGGAIERFTLRFSDAMVPLGDPRQPPPVNVQCPVGGAGRWADQTTFVWEFGAPLPGGTVCTLTLVDTLTSQRGFAVAGQRRFVADAGGPKVRAVLPQGYDGEIEEDQVFLVAANLAPDRASVAANAYCAVDGIGEKIAVDLLAADVPGRLLAGLGKDNYRVTNFLEEAGVPSLSDAPAQRDAALRSVVALKCRRPLPPGRDMALVWSAAITGGGRSAGADQRFDFTVRKPFTARFECGRINPRAGCNPVQPGWVRFSAPIPAAQAKAVRLVGGDREIAPELTDEAKNNAFVSEVRFKAPLPASTSLQLRLPAGIRDESGRPLANAERFPLAVRIDEAPPLVKFAAPFGILEARQGGVLPVTVRNVEPALQGRNVAVSGQSLRVEGSDAEVARWFQAVDKANRTDIRTEKRGTEDVQVNYTGAEPVLAGTRGGTPMTVALPGKGRDFEVVGIPLTRPGFYVVELASPRLGQALLGRAAPRYVAAAALVTNMTVHFKWGRDNSLVWVTALDTGRPVAGADVRITDSCTGRLLARGTSDAAGRAVARRLPQPESYGSCEGEGSSHPLMISARAGGDYSFTLTGWGQGIQPWDFDLPYGYDERPEILHTVFDRTLVRQGETINMKHLYRRPVARGFAREALAGTLRLSHAGSGTQFELPVRLDARGMGLSSWQVPAGAPQGDYALSLQVGDRTIFPNQSFRVDEYRLPTMRATITGPSTALVRPKSVPVELYAGYLSGGGAPNLPVAIRTLYSASSDAPKDYDRYTFGGKPVAEGVRPLDGEGEEAETPLPPTQTLPLTLGPQGTARQAIDVPIAVADTTDMLVEMDYQDANGEMLTASRRLTLHPSAVRLGIRTDGWLMKDDDLRLKLVALGVDGRPLKGQKVEVALYSREILTARRRLIGGFYAYDNQMRTTRIDASCGVSTDAQGLADCRIDPGVSGEVYAVATTTDADGNVARAVTSVWLAGDEDWWFGGDNGDRMDLIAEAPSYKAGDTARFQVRMPFRAATALVTVEREGVLASYVTELSGRDPVIAVPMPGGYAPDVYVSVMAVRGRVEQGWWDWFRGLFGAESEARPATALVDLAKPSYRLGIARVKVGWEGHRLGVRVQADRERFAARDTAHVAVRVTRPGGAPAASADVAFVAVDEALLQLSPNDSWDVLTAMMGDRPLSVLNTTGQAQVVGKRHYGRKAVEAGGGGGDASALNRENFQPVLLWRGTVPLDAQGRARLAVPLSDSLSAFRLVAVAADGDGLFGTGEARVRTAQDLSIYAGLPPLVRTGDRYAAGFTLRNGSDRPMTVTADVAVTPAVARGNPIRVTIPAGGAVPVAWNLTAPGAPGRLSWQVTARAADGRAADRITATQDVAPAVPLETWAATLTRVGAGSPLIVAPPVGALPGGQVSIRLADTLAAPLDGVRDYMSGYPYQCFEQRLSRAVVLGDAGGWQRLAGEMPAYQDGDGLLRYFPSDGLSGSPALSAYALAITSENGWAMPDGARARLIAALQAVVDGRLERETFGGGDQRLIRLAALAALARAGAATPAMIGQVGLAPADMPTGALADWIVALDRTPGLANAPQQRAAAEAVLRTRLAYEGTRLDLADGARAPWWMMVSDDEMAIRATLVALGRPGWQDEAPRMMVGVAARQARGHWDTTPANAWGTVASRRFAQLYPATAIVGSTRATLAGQTRAAAWPLAPSARSLLLPLPAAATPLTLAQSGGAGPWAFVTVRAAVPLRQPLSAGYRIAKRMEVIQRARAGRVSRGDVVRVTITVDAGADRNWVVIDDPVPGGATVLGQLGGQSAALQQGGAAEGAQPSYTERGNGTWRGYFEWLPRGRATVSYTMRLNGAGDFGLPPTRVEAMYSPEIRGAIPNARMQVAER